MSQPRHRAATLLRDGVLWMLGGRDGSTILDTNEVIMCPTVQFIHHSQYLIDPVTGMYSEVDDDRLADGNGENGKSEGQEAP